MCANLEPEIRTAGFAPSIWKGWNGEKSLKGKGEERLVEILENTKIWEWDETHLCQALRTDER